MAKSHAKAKQIHVNSLKTYFDRGQPEKLVRTQRTRLEASSDDRAPSASQVIQTQVNTQETAVVAKSPSQTGNGRAEMDQDFQYSEYSSESEISDEETEKQGIF